MDCCTPTSSVAVLEPPVEAPVGPGPRKGRIRTIALIGPPNCGKSTLFNRLTGMRQKVANYPGVTVEHHSGTMKSFGRPDLTLIDLPGIYSLQSSSEDTRVAIDVLQGNMPGTAAPDESDTRPSIVPVAFCANPCVARAQVAMTRAKQRFIMEFSLLYSAPFDAGSTNP